LEETQVLVLFAADLHGRHETYRWLGDQVKSRRPDLVVLAGDLLCSRAGYPTREAAQRADGDAVLLHIIGWKTSTLYLMGNWDRIALPERPPGVRSLHGRRIEWQGFNLVGYQVTPPFTGGPFEKPEETIAEELDALAPLLDENTLLVTHGPARGILDVTHTGAHVGSVALRGLVDRRPFRVHVHGHIHECFGRDGRHFNVAAGRVMRALLLNAATLEGEVLSA